ncbi:glycosyltransferase [Candidatus Uhrbacteria bacterium]|nr:glycosyltransferase [Candidatus Uhrbacteria bacterium]
MPKISVIIPTFNHGDELEACLASLHRQTEKDIEIIIVDDGSTKPITNATIRFNKNLGAPAARNAGFARSKGEYVIFLDADAELKSHAIERMREVLDAHPEVDFVYPSFKFGYTVFTGQPWNVEELKKQNYIHTSALIRRKAFLGFDESLKKFQDWDLFLTMEEQGKKGIFIDEVLFSLKPRQTGMSQWMPVVAYKLPWSWIGWMPKAVKKYKDAEAIIRRKHNLDQLDSSVRWNDKIWWLFGVVAVVELLSIPAAWNADLNSALAILAGILTLLFAYKKPTAALSILILEFLIGSKGRLLVYGANASNDGGVSLRIILFAAFLLGWFLARIRKTDFRIPTIFLALAALVGYAVCRGLSLNQPYLFADANAWGVLLLIIPIVDLAKCDSPSFWPTMKRVAMVGVAWIILKSIALFYLFSHSFDATWLESVHRWIRRTGIGEITVLGEGGVARVFLQSEIYPLLGAVWLSVDAARRRVGRQHLAVLALCFLAVLISFSRSFWIALALGIFSCIAYVLRRKTWHWFKGLLVAGILSLFALVGVAWFPLPLSTAGNPIDWFTARVDTGESAATSRWELLPILIDKALEAPILGHGFGATVTYQSADPRVVAQTGGLYTTYAFEWGWLDLWIKFGILGPIVMLLLLASIIKKRPQLAPVIVTLAVVHVFTPYLNHPLGLLVLMLAA